MYHEYRLADGTFARKRPITIPWAGRPLYERSRNSADGALTREQKYFHGSVKTDKAVYRTDVRPEKGLYMHGWVNSMDEHRRFSGAAQRLGHPDNDRGSDVLPANHPSVPGCGNSTGPMCGELQNTSRARASGTSFSTATIRTTKHLRRPYLPTVSPADKQRLAGPGGLRTGRNARLETPVSTK